MSSYPVENKLREATELYSALSFFSLAALCFFMPEVLLLTPEFGKDGAIILTLFGLYRGRQGYLIKRYHRRLLAMPRYSMSTRQVPVSKELVFVGRGFRWQPIHTQRLNQLKQVQNEAYTKHSKLKTAVYQYCKLNKGKFLARLLSRNSAVNPFRPPPDVGGKPWLHGVGDEDKPVYIPQYVRVAHTFVAGTPRVGKTRLASIFINQDIRNDMAVIVIDPKGDLELVRDMYSACVAANRLEDFRIVHLGFPELSAQYNPLKNFDQISEVATRITSAIAAEGEGKQFASFAWKYTNIVSMCLQEMNQPISYKSIAFYISRLEQLLVAYADTVLPHQHSNYLEDIERILSNHDAKVDKAGNPPPPMERSKAIIKWLKEYIDESIAKGNIESLHDQIFIDLYDAAIIDKTYYDKITASVGPVFSEINKSNAANIFSFGQSHSEVELMPCIKLRKVIYIGLDSLTNFNIAQAVGKALLSDLVSTAGKIYKEGNSEHLLCLHCDELSEIIQESFVKILNKAGGAGFQVTAYAQTKQDLEVALGSKAWAEMTKGNLNTIFMLRVENEETANILVNVLPKVDVVNHTEVSTVSDTPHGAEGVYFNTTNEDRVQKTSIPMLEVNDITSLPKGQAFVLVNGGELYKVRIPLPVNDGLAPADIKSVMRKINKLDEICEASKETMVAENQLKQEGLEEPLLEAIKKPSIPMDDASSAPLQEDILIETDIQNEADSLVDFIDWLGKRINQGNRQFSLDSQQLVLSNEKQYGADTVFLKPEILGKYQSRSGIATEIIESLLKNRFSNGKTFRIKQSSGESMEVLPCKLKEAFISTGSTLILEGENS